MVEGEPPPGRPSPEELFRQQQIQQIEQAKAGGMDALRNKMLAIVAQARLALDNMKRRVRAAIDGDQTALTKPLDGDINNNGSEKHVVELTKIHVQQAIKAYKENPTLIPVAENTVGGQVMRRLINKIDNPDAITPYGSPYVYEIFRKAINGEIRNPLHALTTDELQYLNGQDPSLGHKVVNALAEAAQGVPGISAQDIEKQSVLRVCLLEHRAFSNFLKFLHQSRSPRLIKQ